MKTQTKLFTISDLANRRVSVFYDVLKHTPEQLNKVLGAAFPHDPLKAAGIGSYNHFYLSHVIPRPGRWTCARQSPENVPVQSLELFEL